MKMIKKDVPKVKGSGGGIDKNDPKKIELFIKYVLSFPFRVIFVIVWGALMFVGCFIGYIFNKSYSIAKIRHEFYIEFDGVFDIK